MTKPQLFPVRQVVNLDEDLSRMIDVYWHGRLLPSRGAAIRELLAWALERRLDLGWTEETTR